MEYLGLILDGETLHLNPSKVAGIRDWPCKLKTLKQAHSFIGVVGYHRPWIPSFAGIARPITHLFVKALRGLVLNGAF
jgi:hypothetical protein